MTCAPRRGVAATAGRETGRSWRLAEARLGRYTGRFQGLREAAGVGRTDGP